MDSEVDFYCGGAGRTASREWEALEKRSARSMVVLEPVVRFERGKWGIVWSSCNFGCSLGVALSFWDGEEEVWSWGNKDFSDFGGALDFWRYWLLDMKIGLWSRLWGLD